MFTALISISLLSAVMLDNYKRGSASRGIADKMVEVTCGGVRGCPRCGKLRHTTRRVRSESSKEFAMGVCSGKALKSRETTLRLARGGTIRVYITGTAVMRDCGRSFSILDVPCLFRSDSRRERTCAGNVLSRLFSSARRCSFGVIKTFKSKSEGVFYRGTIEAPRSLGKLGVHIVRSSGVMGVLRLVNKAKIPVSTSRRCSTVRRKIISNTRSGRVSCMKGGCCRITPMFSEARRYFDASFIMTDAGFVGSLASRSQGVVRSTVTVNMRTRFSD